MADSSKQTHATVQRKHLKWQRAPRPQSSFEGFKALRRVERQLIDGSSLSDALQKVGLSEQAYQELRNRHGGITEEQLRRLKRWPVGRGPRRPPDVRSRLHFVILRNAFRKASRALEESGMLPMSCDGDEAKTEVRKSEEP